MICMMHIINIGQNLIANRINLHENSQDLISISMKEAKMTHGT